jgi:tRNA A37 methylthiotransferase MiaB
VIKKAKGAVKSESVEEILEQFSRGIGIGVRKFVLLADDCGSYGMDLGTDLVELMKALRVSTDVGFSLNIHYIHPSRLIELYPKMNAEVIKSLHFMNVPIQSASQRVLQLMNRNYDLESLLGIVDDMRKLNPDLWVQTHFIYGFPTETRKEFEASFLAAKYFSDAIYFRYSERGLTAHMPQVSAEELDIRQSMIENNIDKLLPTYLGFPKEPQGMFIPQLKGV